MLRGCHSAHAKDKDSGYVIGGITHADRLELWGCLNKIDFSGTKTSIPLSDKDLHETGEIVMVTTFVVVGGCVPALTENGLLAPYWERTEAINEGDMKHIPETILETVLNAHSYTSSS